MVRYRKETNFDFKIEINYKENNVIKKLDLDNIIITNINIVHITNHNYTITNDYIINDDDTITINCTSTNSDKLGRYNILLKYSNNNNNYSQLFEGFELVNDFETINENNITFSSSILFNDIKLNNEISDRISADISLSTAIINTAGGDLGSIVNDISNEISDRISNDISLSSSILNEVSDRISNDISLSSSILNEVSDRISNDISLSNIINNKVIQYQLIDISLSTSTILLNTNTVYNITNTLTNSNTITITLNDVVSGYANEYVMHYTTGATTPTLIYSDFTPLWINNNPLSMKVNKNYTIVFEKINSIVKTCFGEF